MHPCLPVRNLSFFFWHVSTIHVEFSRTLLFFYSYSGEQPQIHIFSLRGETRFCRLSSWAITCWQSQFRATISANSVDRFPRRMENHPRSPLKLNDMEIIFTWEKLKLCKHLVRWTKFFSWTVFQKGSTILASSGMEDCGKEIASDMNYLLLRKKKLQQY